MWGRDGQRVFNIPHDPKTPNPSLDHKSSGAAACEMLESYVVYLRDCKTLMAHTYGPNALGQPLGFVYRVSFREEKAFRGGDLDFSTPSGCLVWFRV